MVTIRKFCFQFSRVLGGVVDCVNINPARVALKPCLETFHLRLQVGHVEEVKLGDYRRERITKAMKPLLFGKDG